ncbi:S-layer homology domain-containing protein [Neobacillus mesonae]|nr:S-layer homology domain-containing protein [Neobacillus mesonae]
MICLPPKIDDEIRINDWAKAAVNELTALGVMYGDQRTDSFAPYRPATRAESAAVLNRVLPLLSYNQP